MTCSSRSMPGQSRSLPPGEWPQADRSAWEEALRPGLRLRPGGAGSRLGVISREIYARRYGAFLGFLQRAGCLDLCALAAAQVTPAAVEAYRAERAGRVSSVTLYNDIAKLHRAARLLAPGRDFSWLAGIEKDLALLRQPRSKFDRLVFSDQLVEAGLTLVAEAETFARHDLDRARAIRNGFMITLLALCPIRLKNFAALEIGSTFRVIDVRWWITLPHHVTKTRRIDERAVPEMLDECIETYLAVARPILMGSKPAIDALWISSTSGQQMTMKNLGSLISRVTLQTLGVDVSPHLFRTAAASTAAAYGASTPHLASALLNHTDPRVTEQHYIRASSTNACRTYAEITMKLVNE